MTGIATYRLNRPRGPFSEIKYLENSANVVFTLLASFYRQTWEVHVVEVSLVYTKSGEGGKRKLGEGE